MTTLTNHLGSKILGRTAVCHSFSILVEKVRPAKVRQLDSFISVKQDILRLDITMNDGRVL